MLKKHKIVLIPIFITILSFITAVLVIFVWKINNKTNQAKLNIHKVEYNLSQLQKNWWQHKETTHNEIQTANLNLQQKLQKLANNLDSFAINEPEYQLRTTVKLTQLAAMQLTFNKEDPLAKELLNQAIIKLIKLNNPKLNPILYKLQDEYNYLLNKSETSLAEVFKKINYIQALLQQLPTSNTVEILNLYLEQAKIAFLQNNSLIYKQTIEYTNQVIKSILWSPDVVLEIQKHLSWLANIEIKNYSLLLQAILNLEDLL